MSTRICTLGVTTMLCLATSVLHAGAPANNDCTGAIALAIPSNTVATSAGATSSSTGIACGTSDNTSPSVWFSIVGTGGVLNVNTCDDGTTFDTKLHVYAGGCAGLTCVAGNDDGGGCSAFRSDVSFPSDVGVEYLVRVLGFSNGEFGEFVLDVSGGPAPPANDDCANAIAVEIPSTTDGSTVGTAPDEGLGCGDTPAPAVWFCVIGTGADLFAELCGSGYDTKISVHEGACEGLSCVTNNDDSCGLQSRVDWSSVAGTKYLIRVFGFGGSAGNFTLTVGGLAPPPSNDGCDGAIELPLPGFASGSTLKAAPDPGLGCDLEFESPAVWYSVVGDGGWLVAKTCGSGFDTALSVHEGACDALSCIVSNDDWCGGQSRVGWDSVDGTTYYVRVYGFANQFGARSGDYVLVVQTLADWITSDSDDDWSTSGAQGQLGWVNGYYNQTLDDDDTYQASDFTPFLNDGSEAPETNPVAVNHWTGTAWDFEGNPPWTFLSRTSTHPNGSNQAEWHNTVRRCEPKGAGAALITWSMNKENTGCGNGVTGILYINDTEVDRATIAFNDAVGVTRSLCVDLQGGDTVDLHLSPLGTDGNGADGCDGSGNRLTVTFDLPDSDGDGWDDCADNCPADSNGLQADGDGDGIGDVCDNCADVANPDQSDVNSNGIGDLCDDSDEDGVPDVTDNCPVTANPDQENGDGDSLGDICDNCPSDDNDDQADRDNDGLGDACDINIAHSKFDWSSDGEQGANNWFNGLYNFTGDGDGQYAAGDFQAFLRDGTDVISPTNHWNGTIYRLVGGNAPWTTVNDEFVHPNGTNSNNNPFTYPDGTAGGPNEEHWAVRRWFSTIEGCVTVSWHTRAQNLNSGGRIAHVFHNGNLIDSAAIGGNDSVGVYRTVVINVGLQDVVDLALDPTNADGNRHDGSDGTFNWMKISATADLDGDSVADCVDNCLGLSNPDQADSDGDGVGDDCDNCAESNPDQADSDEDGVADACDNCPSTSNDVQEDADEDGVGDACDNCPDDANSGQEDEDGDSIGDVCDAAGFKRGDSNGSGLVDLSDALTTFNHLFLGGRAPVCGDAADSNDSGIVDLSDGVHTLGFLFLGGEAPLPPGPFACGSDETDDELGDCDDYLEDSCL